MFPVVRSWMHLVLSKSDAFSNVNKLVPERGGVLRRPRHSRTEHGGSAVSGPLRITSLFSVAMSGRFPGGWKRKPPGRERATFAASQAPSIPPRTARKNGFASSESPPIPRWDAKRPGPSSPRTRRGIPVGTPSSPRFTIRKISTGFGIRSRWRGTGCGRRAAAPRAAPRPAPPLLPSSPRTRRLLYMVRCR